MTGPSGAYAEVIKAVDEMIYAAGGNDPTVIAYMVARAGLLAIRHMRGGQRAAELAYKLADELATGEPL